MVASPAMRRGRPASRSGASRRPKLPRGVAEAGPPSATRIGAAQVRQAPRGTEEAGEAILEFLCALAMRRLQIQDEHLAEIIAEAAADRNRPRALQQTINFVLGALSSRRPARTNLPF